MFGCDKLPNSPPDIDDIIFWPDTVRAQQVATFVCIASDKWDRDNLVSTWECYAGTFLDGAEGDTVRWRAPSRPGIYTMFCTVSDGNYEVTDYVNVPVTLPASTAIFALGNSTADILMIKITSGIYSIGSWGDEPAIDSDEFPRHNIDTESYWISKYEVTQSQWRAVTDYNPSTFIGPDLPVENVSWKDVQRDFITILNAEEGDPTWSLPSESEWEYATRANTSPTFFWGFDYEYELLPDYAWFEENGDSTTHIVGQKFQNPWGLHDVLGNVWEWCLDHYHPSYDDAPIDGSAWIDTAGTNRIIRGGSFASPARDCRPANRDFKDQTESNKTIGFRLVRH